METRRNRNPAKKEKPPFISKEKAGSPYKTSDLYLSAFLKSKGITLQSIDRKNDKVFFIFQGDGDIQDLVKDYFNDSNVKVLSFKAALADLRSIIFNYKDP